MANLLRKPVFTIALMRGEDSVVGQIEAEFRTGLAQNQVSVHRTPWRARNCPLLVLVGK